MRILLVEDDAGMGRVVARGLAAEGHAVEWVRTGAAGQARAQTDPFDAMVLDLGLPDIDGGALCRALRAAGSDLPVLMLTARTSLDEKLEGFGAGADDYLAKPFAFAELLVRLEAIGRRPRASRDRVVVGALTIDRVRRRATVGEDALEVSTRAFDLLAALAEQPGIVVPRDTLIDRVWGNDAEVTANLLDVYIGYVRRSLRRIAGAPRIVTMRGEGYGLFAQPPRT